MFKRIVPVLIVSLLLMITAPIQAQDFYGDGWEAQYFDNGAVSGDPVLTRTESRLDFNYGAGSPAPEIPTDEFSAIFTTNEVFQSDTTYEFVANVDEGVRVTVGGAVVIDAFGAGPGTYTGRRRLVGSQRIVVQYREGAGDARIQFFWRIAGALAPAQLPPGALPGTVIRATSLIVRDGPSVGANRITSIPRGNTYAVIGRDADARWFLLDLGNGTQGWVWGYYLSIDGNEFNPPVYGPFELLGVPDTGFIVKAIDGLKLRVEPNITSAQIGRITWGAQLPVTGRSERGSWYQVIWKGTTGWVYAPVTTVVAGSEENVPFVPGSGALVQIAPAANPDYDVNTQAEDVEVTPTGPTPIPEEAPPSFSN